MRRPPPRSTQSNTLLPYPRSSALLYRPGDNLATLAARIEGHLKTKFPDTRFAIRTEKLGRGRKIIAEILDTPADLTARDAQNDVFVAVRDQMERFGRSEEHTSELQSLMRISYAVFCLKQKK